MALISCFSCNSDNDIHVEEISPDGSRILRCGDCGYLWSPSAQATAPASTRTPFEMAKGRFANSQMVAPDLRTRVNRRKTTFLKSTPEPDPEVAQHLAYYQSLFSPAGLAACEPEELREFATSRLGGDAGSTAVFTRAWKRLGDEESAELTRASIEYLLRGPDTTPLEDRLTDLIDDVDGTGMPGFKEAQLTKVLCAMEPERFLPILTYGAEGGKRDVVVDVFGLHLPKVPDQTSMTSGRLAVWSNDLLLELVGDGFGDAQHASSFLLAAHKRPSRAKVASLR